MQYAAHLPNRRSMLIPVVAFTIGAAGAVGTYAVLDGTDVSVQPTKVIIAEQPAPSRGGVNEAATAAAIGSPGAPSVTKDETAAARAIGGVQPQTSSLAGTTGRHIGGGPPAEHSNAGTARVDSGTELRSDPHGPAAAIGSGPGH